MLVEVISPEEPEVLVGEELSEDLLFPSEVFPLEFPLVFPLELSEDFWSPPFEEFEDWVRAVGVGAN